MLDFSIKQYSHLDLCIEKYQSFNPSYVGFFDKTENLRIHRPKLSGFNPSYVGFFDKTSDSISFFVISRCFNPSYVGFFDKTGRGTGENI